MYSKEALIEWLDHEWHSTKSMLNWFDSVPREARPGPGYSRAIQLAWHLYNCRWNWLDRMTGKGTNQVEWWVEADLLDGLSTQFDGLFERWKATLESWNESDLDRDFTFPHGDETWRFNCRFQAMQMVGHGFYHRGQIAILLTELGAEVTDTDFLYWKFPQQPEWWGKVG